MLFELAALLQSLDDDNLGWDIRANFFTVLLGWAATCIGLEMGAQFLVQYTAWSSSAKTPKGRTAKDVPTSRRIIYLFALPSALALTFQWTLDEPLQNAFLKKYKSGAYRVKDVSVVVRTHSSFVAENEVAVFTIPDRGGKKF